MSEFKDNNGVSKSSFNDLEAAVRDAGRYIRPTDDLRPSALEAAREAYKQQRRNRHLGTAAILMFLFAATGFPGTMLSSHSGLAYTGSAHLQHRALQTAAEPGIGTNWALYEVFSEVRQEQAEKLKHSN